MDFITFLQTYSSFSYLIMFLVAFIEVFVVLGAFFPGQLFIITGGVLAQRGGFDLFTLMLIVFLGTFTGNVVSYYLGKSYGEKFLLKFGKFFYLEKRHIDITKMYMRDHAGKTLILGRFNHVIRSFIPFVAGTSGIGIVKFMAYNLIGTVMWTIAFVMIGYLLAETMNLALRYVSILSIITAIIISAIFYFYVKGNYEKVELP